MIDKIKRLKLYSEKDYTEIIDFPVELVGRDGVVRRYSYADSIRIYERRIESAHVRYSDQEIINAEIYHCSRRLEQIRRSWRQRIRTFERQFVEQRRGSKDRELYEQGKRFLLSYLEQRMPGELMPSMMPNLVNLEEGDDFQVFYVNWVLFHAGTLLYVYRVGNRPEDPLRARYQSFIQLLSVGQHSADTEKLVAYEQADDFAWILTSQRPDPLVQAREGRQLVAVVVGPDGAELREVPPGWLEGIAGEEEASEPTPYQNGVLALQQNNLEEAFDSFKLALEENPYYRDAYWALASLSDVLGRWDDGESYVLMALRYFPDEPRAHFAYGLALFRRQQWEKAEHHFQEAIRHHIYYARAYGFLACTLAARRQYKRAETVLDDGLTVFPRDQELLKLAIPLRKARDWHWQSLALSVFGLALAVGLALWSWTLWGVALVSAVFALVVTLRVHHRKSLHRKLWDWSRPPTRPAEE